ncbi:protein kinase, partial [Spirulina sp. CS-785/01]|uniref:protein kinase domain-containing protein n=1 Tax=Spirulina sp. CS-785/01 TaxID=3021716 RepID=UPI00232C95FF
MSYCINPNCPKPTNPDNILFCQACGSELLVEGQFRVVQPLGTGGFATTYEVEEAGVAKVLKVLTLNNDKAIALFHQEAEVLQQLNHPGIPNVDPDGYFTYTPRENPDPIHCLVMEEIEGENLEEWLEKRGNRPIRQKLALKWLRQLVDILQEVHQKNFFHRDIKPSNIMLRPDGQLALIDFGTVKEITATFLASQNQRGTVLFSRGYAPIEQENGHTVPQSDFFALGRTFVHLLTGKHPLDMYDPYTSQLQWQPETENLHPDLIAFLEQLMARLYRDRPENTAMIFEQLDQLEQRIYIPPPVSATAATATSASPATPPKTAKSAAKRPKFIAGGTMGTFLITWVVSALAVLLTASIVAGLAIKGFVAALIAAAIFGIVNAIVRPILVLFTLPLTILTLGLFLLV